MVSGTFSAGVSASQAWRRFRISWLTCTIAAAGIVIDAVYFGIEMFGDESFFEHFERNLTEHIFILSLIVEFPIIAYLTERVLEGHRLGERSRALELEVAARTHELEDLKNFSENIMASVNDVIFVIGSDGRFHFVSGDSVAVLGFQPEALVGRQFTDIVASGAMAIAVTNFEKVMWGHEVQPYELEVVDSEGESKFIEVSGTAYREDGKVIAQVGVAR